MPSVAAWEVTAPRRAAGVRGRQLLDLGPDPLEGLEAEVGAETVGELGRDHPVGRATPGGTTFAARRETRPSRLVVVPPRSANPAAGSTTSASIDEALSDRVDRDEELDVLERPGGEVRGRGSPTAGPRRAARACSSAPDAAASSIPAVSRPARLGHRAPVRSANHSRPSSQRDPARQEPGSAPEVDGAVHVGAPQRREESGPAARHAASTAAAAATCSAGSASDGSTEHDDDAVALAWLLSGERAGELRRLAPGRVGDATSTSLARGRVATGEQSMTAQALVRRRPGAASGAARAAPRAGRRRARPRCSAASVSAIVARGRPATSSPGSPSPSWASKLSVPMTPLASFTQA